MTGTRISESISTRQRRIAELAGKDPDRALLSLNHHIDLTWLRAAVRDTRSDGATGVDGVTSQQYAARLDENLTDLLGRLKSRTYRAPPVRRAEIPKGDGTTRPLGIPTYEDKIAQRAVKMLLEPIYEQVFYDCSYGFRPGRSVHQAIEAVWRRAMDLDGGWVLEVDIQKYFDTIDRKHLNDFLDQRVRDGVVRALIGKWLNAGVLEEGRVRHSETGTPQGGVISPLLANIYLHYVLDEWFEREVKPRLWGEAYLVRYADDFVIVFRHEDDARRVHAVLPKRFGRFGLTIHPEKTRLVRFHRPGSQGGDRPGTFDFLGFTFHWGRSRKGRPVVRRKTARKRFTRALKAVTEWVRWNRHKPIKEQHAALCRRVRGHFNFYGVTGNAKALDRFRLLVRRTWKKWLGRRSQRAYLTWDAFARLEKRFPLPPVRIKHQYGRS